MSLSGIALPPRAARGEVSAEAPVKARKRTEGSWGGASVETSVHLDSMHCFVNRLEYDLGPNQYVVVPKAQHPKTMRSEKCIPTHVVVGLLGMLTSIQLDDDGSLKASEVANIRSDRMLSAKLESCQLTSTQTLPKDALCMSRVFAEGARVSKHGPTEPRAAGMNMANYNLNARRLMTPPALWATSPAKLGRQAGGV